ncbi:MAG: helix-turn-helix transcriptional regulator [Burkholderiales bacterium]|nr:helix-turn-helix transcriptional regulator [Burkholderiales bacterium]
MNTNQVAHIAALVGEPARTAMLLALMDGRALTAQELAAAGQIKPAAASRHLAQMVEAGLLKVAQQGRHRYHRLASPEVARVLEGIMQLAAQSVPVPRRVVTGPRDSAMRLARTCYDHLAGGIAVAITEHLVEEGAVVIEGDAAQVTERAAAVLGQLGIAREATVGQGKRPHCRPCLDWGERKMHLAGSLGALLCTHCQQQGWLLRRPGTRALQLTPAGAVALRNWLGVKRWDAVVTAPQAR